MKATIFSDGPLLLHAPEKIFLGPGQEALANSLTEAGLPTDRVRVEQNCLLLETAGKKVLFDNGLGSEKLYGPDSGVLLDSLREAGVAPSEIDAVVLTHGHSDHCWGTMADDGTPNFPNATVYLSRASWTSGPRTNQTSGPLVASPVSGNTSCRYAIASACCATRKNSSPAFRPFSRPATPLGIWRFCSMAAGV